MADIRIEGMEEVEDGLGLLQRGLTPAGMNRVMSDFGVIVESAIARAFSSEKAPEAVADIGGATAMAGKPWVALSPNTIAARRGGGGAAKALRDTDRMRQSVSSVVRGLSVEVGAGTEQAPWQHGGTRPYTIRPVRAKLLRFMTAAGVVFAREVHHPGIPARPFVGVDREDVRTMLGAMIRHFEVVME